MGSAWSQFVEKTRRWTNPDEKQLSPRWQVNVAKNISKSGHKLLKLCKESSKISSTWTVVGCVEMPTTAGDSPRWAFQFKCINCERIAIKYQHGKSNPRCWVNHENSPTPQIITEVYSKLMINPDKNSRSLMMEAVHLSGKAINISKTTAPHALSYVLTMYDKMPHGYAVILTLPAFFCLTQRHLRKK
ncbi:MAG: iron-containing alcohol dehydrogenase [Candidatus Omnitrophota bacterium]